METPEIRYATTTDGVRIGFALCFADAPGTPVLAMRPAIVSHAENLMETWFKADGSRPVAVVDPRRSGISDRGPCDLSPEARSLDLSAVADELGWARVFVLATGDSCFAAIPFAAINKDGVAGIALGEPAVDGDAFLKSRVVGFGAGSIDWEIHTEILAWILLGRRAETSGAEIKAFAQSIRFAQTPDDLEAQFAALEGVDVTGYLDDVTCPVMVMLTPSRSTVEGFTEVEKRVKGARRVTGSMEETWSLFDPFFASNEPVSADAMHSSLGQSEARAFRTILFTDVVASTPLLAQLKDEKMRAVMHDHDEVLEAAVTDNGGRVVKTIGDAFMAEFAVPSRAVEAAIAAQRGIRDKFADSDVPIRLRIGINAGEPIEEDGDLHGASVVIAKRLESEAENGGILVSDVVRSAVAGKEFEFTDRGEVSLKGFDEMVRAWSVEW